MNDTTNERDALIRAEAANLELADLPKDQLVELTRRVFNRVGDSARTSKNDYLAKLVTAGREKVVDAIVAMVNDGELEFVLEDDTEPAPAPIETKPAKQRKPGPQESAPAADDGEVARKMREAFQMLGITPAAAPIDEDAVRNIAHGVATNLIGEQIDTITRNVSEIVDAALAGVSMPERIVVVNAQGERRPIEGHVHAAFETVLAHASIRDNILLVGPAGCGKTQLAHQVADALDLPFAFVSCTGGMSESQLLGWLLPVSEGGRFTYVPSSFVNAYENGGVFLIDEIDAADENVLLVINSAIANGHLALPQRTEKPVAKRHENFVCIAAANTYGHGADRIYAGRNQLDGATLDRFRCAIVEMNYDAKLEGTLIDPEVLAWGVAIRGAITGHKLRRVMSTRALVGFTRQKAALKWGANEWERSYFADWTRDELAKAGR